MDSNTNHDLPAERQYRNLLFDFYSVLLTEKQREIFTLHHMDDCSLAEIGTIMCITPQAVADFLKRTLTRLNKYEEQLGLVGKFNNHQNTVSEIGSLLAELEKPGRCDIDKITTRVRTLVDSLVV